MTDKQLPSLSQSEIFLATEGDAWFIRNSEFLRSCTVFQSVEFIRETLFPFKAQINNLVEIGCGPGYKLEKLFVDFQSKNGSGLDPSALAISAAIERVKNSGIELEFHVGVSSSLPFYSNSADLVFLGFFLYLVPRDEILITVSEIDRILKPGSFLAIEDFDVPVSTQNLYKHDDRLISFKEDYSRYFTGELGYHLIEKHSYSHKSDHFSTDREERIATSILFKPFESSNNS
jgi:ubiquinone/menaquinone biosynthesis C-methylase UbiE